jgi:DNA-binding CsgD family transcriptional regulator
MHLGIAYYRAREYPQALRFLRLVPDDADIIRARAITFEAWVAFEQADMRGAADTFAAALRHVNTCRHYDRFTGASALYGLAFLCAEIPRLDLWPELRKRAMRFDWSAGGVALPQFFLAIAASYITEMRGEFEDAQEWAARAHSSSPSASCEIQALVRLAALVGRYDESRAHTYFVRRAHQRYDEVGVEALVRDDYAVPLALCEELAQGSRPRDAAPLMTYHEAVIAARVRGTKDAAMLAALAALAGGLMDDALGRRVRAIERYKSAHKRYDALGYGRRAAVAAYRLALLTNEEHYRTYIDDVVRDASPAYWLRERIAQFGVRDLRLSSRHAEVLSLLGAGKSNKEIASIRRGSWYAARNIVRELISMFGVRSRSELVRVAIARGIVADTSAGKTA